MIQYAFKLCMLVTLAILIAGCGSTQKVNEQLENVARQWCMTIRASQVIPVYPLTEDIQPGDIFLVQVPVDEQQRVYAERGFLALDNHLHRIELLPAVGDSPYTGFYKESFGLPTNKVLPSHWLSPADDELAWTNAPDAAFPSYSFSVRSGSGFSLALPVQGIPIGLSLMGSSSADGTVTIADAKTYGLDILRINKAVNDWYASNERGIQSMLKDFGPRKDAETGEWNYNYIRVVSRVYLTKRLDVSLRDAEAMNAGADIGAPKPVELLLLDPSDDTARVTAETYASRVESLNGMLDSALSQVDASGVLPGGSVRVASASAGSITMRETFSRHLVIGYLAFDRRIESGGVLGPPIPTHAILAGDINDPGVFQFVPEERALRELVQQMRRSDKSSEIRSKVVTVLGDDFADAYARFTDADQLPGFLSLIDIYKSADAPGSDARLKEIIDAFEVALQEAGS